MLHQFDRVNGIQMHYVEEGEGNTLIFLHGFPEFWYSWRKQIPVFSTDFKVIAPDLRGYNQTERPKGKKHYHIKLLVKDIHDLILKTSTTGKACIIGHDWGGAVAWKLAMEYPEAVDKLIILNCPHPSVFRKNLKRNPRQMLRSWYMGFFQIPFIPEFLLSLNLKTFLRRNLKGWSYNPDAFTDEDIEKYAEVFRENGALTAAINYYRATAADQRSLSGKNTMLQMPVLMIWGENDKALGKELTYGTERYCPAGFEIHYIPDCSHWVQHEYPEMVNTLISDFIGDPQQGY